MTSVPRVPCCHSYACNCLHLDNFFEVVHLLEGWRDMEATVLEEQAAILEFHKSV